MLLWVNGTPERDIATRRHKDATSFTLRKCQSEMRKRDTCVIDISAADSKDEHNSEPTLRERQGKGTVYSKVLCLNLLPKFQVFA